MASAEELATQSLSAADSQMRLRLRGRASSAADGHGSRKPPNPSKAFRGSRTVLLTSATFASSTSSEQPLRLTRRRSQRSSRTDAVHGSSSRRRWSKSPSVDHVIGFPMGSSSDAS
eukprot:s7346_g2.t1